MTTTTSTSTNGTGAARTQAYVILAAAHQLAATQPTFTSEDLAVAAWKMDPAMFGMDGYYSSYPDNNRVRAALCGKKATLIRKGVLVQVGPKRYRLGDGRIPTPEEVEMQRLTGSRANVLVQSGRKDEVRFVDACAFFRIAEGDGAKAGEQIATVRAFLSARAEERGDDDAGGVRALLNLVEWLRGRYEKHLSLLANRGLPNGVKGRGSKW